MKWLLIWIFEIHPTLLLSLGNIQLWILKVLKLLVVKWGQVLTLEKCLIGRGLGFGKCKTQRAYMHIPRMIPN